MKMNIRLTRYDYYEDYKDAFGWAAAAGIKKDAAYQRAAASDIITFKGIHGLSTRNYKKEKFIVFFKI